MHDPYEHYPQNRPMPHPGTGDSNDLRPQFGDGIEFNPQPAARAQATAGDDRDPRTRAFDWAIVELWYWINNDYAHKTTSDRTDIRAIEDTWAEIATRLEVWKTAPRPAPSSPGDVGGGAEEF